MSSGKKISKLLANYLLLFIQSFLSSKTFVQFVWSFQLFLRERNIIKERNVTEKNHYGRYLVLYDTHVNWKANYSKKSRKESLPPSSTNTRCVFCEVLESFSPFVTPQVGRRRPWGCLKKIKQQKISLQFRKCLGRYAPSYI